jgi:hypothetical protein
MVEEEAEVLVLLVAMALALLEAQEVQVLHLPLLEFL